MNQSTSFAQVATNLLNVLQGYIVLTVLLTLGAANAWGEEPTLEINTTNFTELSGSGYAAYNGERDINGVTIYSNQVMVQSGKIQFQKSNGILYNKTPLPGNISKISIATPDDLIIYVGEESNPSSTTVQSGNTITGNNKYFAIKASSSATPTTVTITITYEAASGGGNIDDSGSATINFGTNDVKINSTSVTGDDNLGYSWKITTAGTTSFTPQPTYSQVGSSSNPATSITFTTTLPKEVTITNFSAKFGGYSGTAGNVTLKVGNTSVGTGKLNATSDVTVTNTTEATGKVLTVTVTNIAKGVKVYNISYTYESVISVQTYTITWKNEDGTVLETDNNVPYGETPSYDGATPTKTATAQYTYTFNAWTPAISTVTGNATYTATFTETINQYQVTFNMNGHGTAPATQTIEYGSKVSEPSAPTADGYEFAGWYKDEQCTTPWDFDTDVVTGSTTIYAKWLQIFTITWKANGLEYTTTKVTEGNLITPPSSPDLGNYCGQVFVGWTTAEMVETTNVAPTLYPNPTPFPTATKETPTTFYAVFADYEN